MNWIVAKIFNRSSLITVLRYGLSLFGFWLMTEKGFDPAAWETIAGGVLAIATALFGGADAAKNKVNVNGKSVELKSLTSTLQSQIENAVDRSKSRSIFDVFFGK